jgi:transcription termination factor Rho
MQDKVLFQLELLICFPLGKGQRGMIVAQPKTGKTMLLKEIAMLLLLIILKFI